MPDTTDTTTTTAPAAPPAAVDKHGQAVKLTGKCSARSSDGHACKLDAGHPPAAASRHPGELAHRTTDGRTFRTRVLDAIESAAERTGEIALEAIEAIARDAIANGAKRLGARLAKLAGRL